VTLLHTDIEFFSPLSIKEHPLDVYAAAPGSKIILNAYAFGDGPVKVWEPGDKAPELREALRDPSVMCVAWNINYERTVYRAKGLDIPLERWIDVMVLARYAGLPGKLKNCAKVPLLRVPAEDKTKSETLLINKFCMPAKDGTVKTKANAPEDWELFREYCRKDVLTMRHIYNWLLPRFPLPARERELWLLDQRINERGLPVDAKLARAGMRETARLIQEANHQLKDLTGLDNPNSVQQMLGWAKDRGYPYDSLGKDFLKQHLTACPLVNNMQNIGAL